MPWGVEFLLIFVGLVALFLIGVPIGFSMIIVAMVGLALASPQGLDYVINQFGNIAYDNIYEQTVFIAIPLFVLMTEFMTHGGISSKLIDMSLKLMGRFPGGLAIVTVAASTIFGAVCSSTVIGAMVMGEMIFPEADSRKYNMRMIAGTIAAGGTLSVLIPPSGAFILWAIITEVSVGDLFIAGLIPGLFAAIVFCLYIVFDAKRHPSSYPVLSPVPAKEKLLSVLRGWDVVLLIGVTIGGLYAGVGTVTELSAVGALLALILGIRTGKLSLGKIWLSSKNTAGMVAIFVVLLIGAWLLINLMTYTQIPQHLSELIVSNNLTSFQLIVAVMVLFFILGMFIDATSVMLITIPLFLTSFQKMEVDLVWLGVLVTINVMIATLTPPVGLNLFVIQSIGKKYGITFIDVVRGSLPFIGLLLIVMVFVWIFPSLATWLPSTMR